MKQRLGDKSQVEVWTDVDAAAMTLGTGTPQGLDLAFWVNNGRTEELALVLDKDEASILKMTILDHSAELKRELLRFVHFIESLGVLPAQQGFTPETRGKLIQYYRSFEQLVDMAIEFDQVDWYKLAQDSERS